MTDTKKWEEMFDKKFGNNLELNEGMMGLAVEEYHSNATKKVKNFISSLLLQTQLETLEWCEREVVGEDSKLNPPKMIKGGTMFETKEQFIENQLRKEQRQTIKNKMEEIKK